MPRFIAALTALTLLAAPALAQTTATEPAPTEQPPASGEAAAADKPADTAQPAPDQQPQPDEVVVAQHGEWFVICEPGGEPCVIAQKGEDKDGREIMEVRIRKVKEGESKDQKVVAAIQVAVPIGVILPPGLTLQVDGRKPRPAAYRYCNPTACIVVTGLDDGIISEFKKGAKAVFTLVAPRGGQVPVEISLSGFTAAYNSLK